MEKKLILAFLVLVFLYPFTTLKALVLSPSMAVNDNAFFFISNPEKNKIQVFDSYGTYIKDFPSQEKLGSIQKIISCPCGGYLLVVDFAKKEIVAIDDRTGEALHRIRGIVSIGDVTISREKYRYEGVVNLTTNSIHLYNDNGTLLRAIKGESLFKEASAIHLNYQNHLFVADNKSQKLIELDVKGAFIRSIQGVDGAFGKILDIDSDQMGNLYVLDEKKGLLKFSKEGKKSKQIPYPTDFKPVDLGVDNTEASIYLFSDTGLQKLSLDFVGQIKVQKPLLTNKKTVIQLKVGSRILTPVGFDVKIMDTTPFIDPTSNRTLVPLRVISESFKAAVTWDSRLRQVTLIKGSTKILLWIGSKTATINNTSKTLDAAPLIKDNRTFVPLRFIGEAFSAEVQWYPDKQLIRIVSPFVG